MRRLVVSRTPFPEASEAKIPTSKQWKQPHFSQESVLPHMATHRGAFVTGGMTAPAIQAFTRQAHSNLHPS